MPDGLMNVGIGYGGGNIRVEKEKNLRGDVVADEEIEK